MFLVKNFEECLEDLIKLKMSLFLKNRKTFRLTEGTGLVTNSIQRAFYNQGWIIYQGLCRLFLTASESALGAKQLTMFLICPPGQINVFVKKQTM